MSDEKRLIDNEDTGVNYKKKLRICMVILAVVAILAIASFIVFIVQTATKIDYPEQH